ncbi:hypothetical protein FIV42_01220 [Persicimonas caeni]|uniref:Uncharacterized protein n=1 Tax=Persicimonas caeni TaxID=2292766 RepID=A0A4Y6PM65_PERCE|nr:hypothetical protein [Persicimonas caeni]QDG49404.1 hypothetical protein FIV42_01220 [Persicimonas caeni]QED30625.1 hypothetical protein FRD00_01215 [Persicimonas caeni]
MSQEQNQSATMTLWILWGSMLSSVFIYVVVLFVISQNKEGFTPPDPGLIQTLLIAFGAVSVAEAGAIFYLRKVTFFSKLEDGAFDTIDELRDAYKTASILSWGLSESVAVFGLVLGVLTRDPMYYLYFAPPAIALFLLLTPKLGRYEEQWKAKHSKPSTPTTW